MCVDSGFLGSIIKTETMYVKKLSLEMFMEEWEKKQENKKKIKNLRLWYRPVSYKSTAIKKEK